MSLEERVARIEGILEQMDKRLTKLENEVSRLREEMGGEINSLRGEVNSLRREVREEINSLRDMVWSQFKWTIGILITMWITIIITILFK